MPKVWFITGSLVDNLAPPVHLILGTDAIDRVRQANTIRNEEMEKWLPLSTSTDADDAKQKMNLSNAATQ